jgi:hypothetical protein
VDGGQRQYQYGEEDDPRGDGTHLEPFRKEKGGNKKQCDTDRKHQADYVVDVHSPSTNFCTRPSRAKTATVSRMNTTTDISSPFQSRPHRTGPPEGFNAWFRRDPRAFTVS